MAKKKKPIVKRTPEQEKEIEAAGKRMNEAEKYYKEAEQYYKQCYRDWVDLALGPPRILPPVPPEELKRMQTKGAE